ncbi:DUF6333 family protein [Streptomyces sp. NPDC048483]|uniref:DUF6333 family protein n=1 Tax=Streptomyces sp. NPDC048483 TaxID=3154927 RepID=UPI003437EA40
MTSAHDHDAPTGTDPDEELQAWGTVELTLLFPPFPAPGEAGGPVLALHDPVRARQVVEALGTVEEIVARLPDRSWEDLPEPETRADLDLVAVGCWGRLVRIVDPALGSSFTVLAMDEEIARQRKRHPEARIVASICLELGVGHEEDTVQLPGGGRVSAVRWDSSDPDAWRVHGDPAEMLRVLGVDRAVAVDAGFDLDAEPRERLWRQLGSLALGGFSSDDADGRQVSVFRVRRTEQTEGDLEEVWMGE